MSKSKSSKKNGSTAKSVTKRRTKHTINCYHLYYALERELVLQKHGIRPHVKYTSPDEWKNYGDLSRVFPPRPSRYQFLQLSNIWFLKRKSKARTRHWKDQDLISLQGLTKAISSSWKNCDPEVKGYVTAVARIIKDRCHEIQSGKIATKSPTTLSTTIELKPSDSSPKFEPAMEDEQKTYGHGVSMSSNTSTISVQGLPYAVHNAG
eukprot:scaffold323191_cov89-Cyclotella_meneghiniana.AAC.2